MATSLKIVPYYTSPGGSPPSAGIVSHRFSPPVLHAVLSRYDCPEVEATDYAISLDFGSQGWNVRLDTLGSNVA